jgi:hypothetical protein
MRNISETITIDLGTLVGLGSIDGLNEFSEEQLMDRGQIPEYAILGDIEYTVTGVDGAGNIHIRVDAELHAIDEDEDDE